VVAAGPYLLFVLLSTHTTEALKEREAKPLFDSPYLGSVNRKSEKIADFKTMNEL